MRTPSMVTFGFAVAIGTFLLQTPVGAQGPGSPTSDPTPEAQITKQLEDADTQVQRDAERDPTTVLDRMRAIASQKEAEPAKPIELDGIVGVPGDPKFEAQLARKLDDMNRQAEDEANNDPTIQR